MRVDHLMSTRADLPFDHSVDVDLAALFIEAKDLQMWRRTRQKC